MMRRQIQRLEVMVVILDLRTFHHVVSHGTEELLNTFHDKRHRMQCTGVGLTTRQRDINRFCFELGVDFC